MDGIETETAKEHRRKNREAQRRWRERNKEKNQVKALRGYHKRKRGITEEQKATRKEYMRQWYAKNREAILAKRQELKDRNEFSLKDAD
jgi:hypothetical protein